MKELLKDIVAPALAAQMLKYQVGQAIFCPLCSAVMDWQSAVSVDIHGTKEGIETLLYSKVFCSRCFDARVNPNSDLMSKATGKPVVITVTDGRDWEDELSYYPVDTSVDPIKISFGTIHRTPGKRPGGRRQRSVVHVVGKRLLGAPPSPYSFAVYQAEPSYHVVELSTGMGVAGHGTTQDEAVRKAIRSLRKAGPDKLAASVAKCRVINPDFAPASAIREMEVAI